MLLVRSHTGKLFKIAMRFLIRFYSDTIFFKHFSVIYFFLYQMYSMHFLFFLKYFKFLYNFVAFKAILRVYVIQLLAAKYVNKVYIYQYLSTAIM